MFGHCQYPCHFDSPIWRRCAYSAGSPCSPGPAGPRTLRSSFCATRSRCSSVRSRPRGCSGLTGRSWPRWPGCCPWPAPPVAAARLAADPAGLARGPGQPAMDLPAPWSRAAPRDAVRAGAGGGDGTRQPGLGISAHPRRADRPGRQARAVDGVADPQRGGHRSCARAVRASLAGIPGRSGEDHPGGGLLSCRYRVPAPPVRAVLHRDTAPGAGTWPGSPPIPRASG
jgi:hypothetical protein